MQTKRRRRRPETSAQSPRPSLAAWLAAGAAWFKPEDLAPLRDVAESRLRERLATAMRDADRAKADLAALRHGKPSTTPPRKEVVAGSIPEIVRTFIQTHPGTTAGDIVGHVATVKPGANISNVHSALYRESKPDGVLRREGPKGESRYFTKETNGAG